MWDPSSAARDQTCVPCIPEGRLLLALCRPAPVVGISALLGSSAPNLHTLGKRNPILPFKLLCSLCVYSMGFLVALSERNRGKYAHSIFPETGVSLHILQIVPWESLCHENSKRCYQHARPFTFLTTNL